MIVYTSQSVAEAALVPFEGRPEDMGGEVLEGDVRIALRIDFQQGPVTAGIFEATRGKVRVTFPFTEHATIHEGEVTLTDAEGVRRTYVPGDSYLIKQGAVVVWEVQGERLRKSFFNVREG